MVVSTAGEQVERLHFTEQVLVAQAVAEMLAEVKLVVVLQTLCQELQEQQILVAAVVVLLLYKQAAFIMQQAVQAVQVL